MESETHAEGEQKTKKLKLKKVGKFLEKYLTPIAVLIGAVIIAFALMHGNSTTPSDQQGQAPAPVVDIKDVQTEGVPFIGNANAPTTIALFYDYQCPFCKQFEQAVSPQLMANYVSSGKTKIVLKDFQFLGEDSSTAALYGRAVWEAYPDRFADWFKAMFDAQDDEGDKGFGDLASIEKLTKSVPGIDVAKVEKLMEQNKEKYQAAIDASRQEGATLGVNGTPSIIVGKKLITGMSPAQYYAAISAELDKQLKK